MSLMDSEVNQTYCPGICMEGMKKTTKSSIKVINY